MKTTITQALDGEPILTVEGENAPEAVAIAYLKVLEMLESKPRGKEKEEEVNA